MLSAVWTGLEPATPCVTGRYSNQLNYHTVYLLFPIASAKVSIFFKSQNISYRFLQIFHALFRCTRCRKMPYSLGSASAGSLSHRSNQRKNSRWNSTPFCGLLIQWFSSGKMSIRDGILRNCAALNAIIPCEARMR